MEDIHHEINNVQEEPIQKEKCKEENKVSNTLRCHLCDSKHEFGSEYLLQKHLSKKHGLEITCPLCNDAFQQYDQFVEHKDMCKRNINCKFVMRSSRQKQTLSGIREICMKILI